MRMVAAMIKLMNPSLITVGLSRKTKNKNIVQMINIRSTRYSTSGVVLKIRIKILNLSVLKIAWSFSMNQLIIIRYPREKIAVPNKFSDLAFNIITVHSMRLTNRVLAIWYYREAGEFKIWEINRLKRKKICQCTSLGGYHLPSWVGSRMCVGKTLDYSLISIQIDWQ